MNQELAAKAAREAFYAACRAIIESPKLPRWAITAKPYLKAIKDNDYGLEDPVMCVLYALNNLHNWRGEQARRVKLQLNEAIK